MRFASMSLYMNLCKDLYLRVHLTVHNSLSAYSHSLGITWHCELAEEKAKPLGTTFSKLQLRSVALPFNAANSLAMQTLRRRSTIPTTCGHVRPLKQVEGTGHFWPTFPPTCLVATEDTIIHHAPHAPQLLLRLNNVSFPNLELDSNRPRLSIPG